MQGPLQALLWVILRNYTKYLHLTITVGTKKIFKFFSAKMIKYKTWKGKTIQFLLLFMKKSEMIEIFSIHLHLCYNFQLTCMFTISKSFKAFDCEPPTTSWKPLDVAEPIRAEKFIAIFIVLHLCIVIIQFLWAYYIYRILAYIACTHALRAPEFNAHL